MRHKYLCDKAPITDNVLKADVYERCNFAQPQPVDLGNGDYEGVDIFPGDDTPRTFIECNLINCKVPRGSKVVGGNTALIVRDVEKQDGAIVDRVVGKMSGPDVNREYDCSSKVIHGSPEEVVKSDSTKGKDRLWQ